MLDAPPKNDPVSGTAPLACRRCGKAFESRRRLYGHITGKHLRRPGLKNSHIQTENLVECQKGYIAAFLDGEGGIQITRSTRPNRVYSLALHPMVYFTNTNRAVIRRMKTWLSCGCVTRKRSALPTHRDTYALNITGTRNVLELLKTLMPYLIVKRRQARVLIAYCESRLGHYLGKDRRFNDEELRLYSELKRLNQKGGKNRRPRMVA
jgi:hypothetical protein